ncbi:hypothetical protein ACHWQZ_G018810 [Mnemiopsis leidyi]
MITFYRNFTSTSSCCTAPRGSTSCSTSSASSTSCSTSTSCPSCSCPTSFGRSPFCRSTFACSRRGRFAFRSSHFFVPLHCPYFLGDRFRSYCLALNLYGSPKALLCVFQQWLVSRHLK